MTAPEIALQAVGLFALACWILAWIASGRILRERQTDRWRHRDHWSPGVSQQEAEWHALAMKRASLFADPELAEAAYRQTLARLRNGRRP